MNMEIAASKEDTKTSIQLIKNGKPTFWLIGAITFEVAADIALAAGAFKLMKFFKKQLNLLKGILVNQSIADSPPLKKATYL